MPEQWGQLSHLKAQISLCFCSCGVHQPLLGVSGHLILEDGEEVDIHSSRFDQVYSFYCLILDSAQLFGHLFGRQGLARNGTVFPNSKGGKRLHLFHQAALATCHCPCAMTTMMEMVIYSAVVRAGGE